MNMIIGKFTYSTTNDTYTGELYSPVLPAKVSIEPNPNRGGKAPDYRLLADGHEIGAAWKRTTRDKGAPFLSVHLDDPGLPAPVDAMLSQSGELVWNRGRAPARPAQPGPQAG
jgi:uncharacterized protein (DUF736 family)